MAKVCRLYVGLLTALALCKYSVAGGNATDASANRTASHCDHHGNCSDAVSPADSPDGGWNGHFSKCPEELTGYCVHGECRYLKEHRMPSCRCQQGFVGSRCEYVDLDWQIGERRQIIIASVIAGLVFLILLTVFICLCSHRRCRPCCRRERRRKDDAGGGTEKLAMMAAGAAKTDPAEAAPPGAV